MTDDAKPKLKPCEDNVWYRLATVHGVQSGNYFHDIDFDLAAKNRATWNRYFTQALDARQKANLIKRGFAADELDALLTDEDQAAIDTRLAGMAEPGLNDDIDFSGTVFDRLLDMRGFVFSRRVNFKRCQFEKAVYFNEAAFSDYAGFREAVFSGDADFKRAYFKTKQISKKLRLITQVSKKLCSVTMLTTKRQLSMIAGISVRLYFKTIQTLRRPHFGARFISVDL